MRFILLLAFCTLSITASAQFWQKKNKTRYPQLDEANHTSATTISAATKVYLPNVVAAVLNQRAYSLDIAEALLLKEAKHHMRYRQYTTASTDFNTLAKLYTVAKRFSEAQWFLLQSNAISKRESNDQLTITNLLDLATIKAAIGELALARTDLKEAHDLASLKGMSTDLAEIEKLTREIELKNGSASFAKTEVKYAAAIEADKKAKAQ
ncbi:hypothetical protein GCM10027049_03650 [Mucilaginibacter puniceus]